MGGEEMLDERRERARQRQAQMMDGVPMPDVSTTRSILGGVPVSRWLVAQRSIVGGVLLDLGCGNRPYQGWYEVITERAVGLDAAPGSRADIAGFADSLPFREAAFDVVLATEVLEHVADVRATLSEIRRVLRPEGWLVVSVPFLYPTHEAPFDYRRFTHFGLVALLERAGFDSISIAAKGGPLLLVSHFGVVALTGVLRSVAQRFGADEHSTEQFIERVAGPPQRRLARWIDARPLGRFNGVVSLGYVAVARRPC
jgi:SAM-dependent methyltransferase